MTSDAKSVYSLIANHDDFKSFIPKDISVSIRCKGKSLNWNKPLEIEIDEEDVGVPEADISMLNVGSFVISENLYKDYFDKLKESCEFLPLMLGDRDFRLVNVVFVADCVDKNRSKFNEFGGVFKTMRAYILHIIEKQKSPYRRTVGAFLFIWWRWRDLNPRPSILH